MVMLLQEFSRLVRDGGRLHEELWDLVYVWDSLLRGMSIGISNLGLDIGRGSLA